MLEKAELKARLAKIQDPSLTDALLDWVYHSDGQIRLFVEDYETLYKESPFRTLFVKGYDHPDLAAKYEPLMDSGIFERLNQRYPRNRNWRYDGMIVLLRRD